MADRAVGVLSGSSALVTGASRGLGRSFAIELARMGANVTVVARSVADLDSTASVIRSCGVECMTVVGDVCDDAVAERAVAQTVDRFGAIDLLVNNAGIARIAAFADDDIDTWWNVITVNLRAAAVWTQAVLPDMRRHRSGRIINVSSPAAAHTPLPYLTSYTASKAALSQFTAAFASEIAPDGIVVLALGPVALTDMTRTLWENDVMPEGMRDRYRKTFAHAAPLEALSLEVFRFFATGGADHLTGSYGGAAGTRFDTPDDLRNQEPTPAAGLLPARDLSSRTTP